MTASLTQPVTQIKHEVTPLLELKRVGLTASLVQETTPTREEKAIATGKFYILLAAIDGKEASLVECKTAMSDAHAAALRFEGTTGQITSFKVRATHLAGQRDALTQHANFLLGKHEGSLEMQATQAPLLAAATISVPAPVSYRNDPHHADGHPDFDKSVQSSA